MTKSLFAICTASVLTVSAQAQMRITEWMYQDDLGGQEWVELTNIGSTAINMSGWSFDDDSRTPGGFSLSGFGLVQPGESVIFSEDSASAFRSYWQLDASVKVLGGYTNNLGRNDEINIFNGSTLVDRLTYGDQTLGTIRTNGVTGNPLSLDVLGTNNAFGWDYAEPGDIYGSYGGDLPGGLPEDGPSIGNPGKFTLVPEPSTAVLLGLAGLGLAARRRRQA